MPLLRDFERRLEGLVEGFFAKAFRSGVQPVELAKRLLREMDANQTISATFADVQPPTATVTAPNGAEQTYVGGHMNLTWTAADNVAVTTVDLDVSRAGAGGPFESIAAGIANSGTFDWLVSGPATSTAFVRVTAHDAAGNTGQDLSDAAFEIFATAGVLDGPITEFGLVSMVSRYRDLYRALAVGTRAV